MGELEEQLELVVAQEGQGLASEAVEPSITALALAVGSPTLPAVTCKATAWMAASVAWATSAAAVLQAWALSVAVAAVLWGIVWADAAASWVTAAACWVTVREAAVVRWVTAAGLSAAVTVTCEQMDAAFLFQRAGATLFISALVLLIPSFLPCPYLHVTHRGGFHSSVCSPSLHPSCIPHAFLCSFSHLCLF